jgi:fucose permease
MVAGQLNNVSKTKNPVPLTLAAFAALGMVGLYHTIVGAALPAIRLSLRLDLSQAGYLGSSAWLGFAIAVFAGGALSDVIRSQRVLAIGCWLIGMNALLFGRWMSVLSNCFFIGMVGAGTGIIVSSSSALVLELFPGKEGRVIHFHHSCYAFGAIAGPMLMANLLAQAGDWRWAYQGGGLFMLIIGGFLAALPPHDPVKRKTWDSRSVLLLFKEKTMILLILIIFLSVGVQNGIYFWLVSFLKEIRSFPIVGAGLGLSLFSIGVGTGRLLSGWVVSKIGILTVLFILLLLLMGSLFFLLRITTGPWIWVICFTAGLGCSGLFPGLLTLGGIHFPHLSGTAIGILGTAAGIGSTFMPWSMSWVSQVSTLEKGFSLAFFFAFLTLILLSFSFRRFRLIEKAT